MTMRQQNGRVLLLMKQKLSGLKAYYKEHPKRFWVLGGVLVLILIYIFTSSAPSTTTVIPVEEITLKQTILATGQVTSNTDLSLSFSTSGIIARLPATVGQKVYAGQVLAELENSNEYASLKNAQANYQKVLSGTSNEEVAVAEASLGSAKASLENTRKTQNTLVENAYRALVNTDLTPELISGIGTNAPTVTGTYTGATQGSYTITTYSSGSGGQFSFSGIETGGGAMNSSSPVALGSKGLFVQFSSSSSIGDVWKVSFPNTKSANYLTDYNAYQSALSTRESTLSAAETAVTEKEANLALKKAAARPADIAVAQAQVDAAAAVYNKTVLRAPAGGTVVHVDSKIGERADAAKQIVVIQDVGNLYVEANINETNIAKVALEQPVVMTLDAFGPETFINGKVVHIDPSATTTDGVANYKIKVSIIPPCEVGAICVIKNDMIRPGMNANMTITAWEHQAVIAIPKAAVTTKDGVSTVEIVVNEKKKEYETRTVRTTFLGDGNLIEVESGLTVGEKIVVSSK